jgi:adenylate cyclase
MHFLGLAQLVLGQDARAAETFRERIRQAPNTDLSRAMLVSALGHLGEVDEARQVWAELKAINPGYSPAEHVGRLPFRNPADGERLLRGIDLSGVSL